VNNEINQIAMTISQTVPAEQIYLFGSYAAGTQNSNSDYDFFVVLPDGSLRPLEAMRQIHHALFPLNIPLSVDILANYRSSFDRMRNLPNSVEKEVALKGVLLFER
jgi:predicted nucleotidyltransferase